MKRKLLWFALFTAIFIWLGKDAQAQNPRPSAAGSAGCVQVHSSTGNTISCGGSTVVASLPSASANANAIYLVHDGTSSSDCTAGGGTSQSLCVSNGSVWVALGGGGSSLTPCGPTVGEVQLFASSTTLGCDAAFVGDAVNHLFKIGGAPITPFPGLYVGPDESTLPVGVQDWTNGVGGTQNVLITSTALTALQIEAAQTGSESSGVLSIVNIGTGSPSAIYTENHSADDSLNLAIQGTAYADFANSTGVWGGYFTAGVLQNVVAAEVGGIVLWQPLFENSGTATTYWSLFAQDLGPVTASITNPYYSWFDSRGVRRVKEDATFNSVGQAIEALYNPQFAKYTPGAVDYERVVLGEWESNVAFITTENGGTGTLRNIQIDGAEVDLGTASHLIKVPSLTASLSVFTDSSQRLVSGPALSDIALTASPLSQFASTTSAQLRGIISDESGSGVAIFGGSTLFEAPIFRGTSSTISGALTIGTCNTATVTVTGATTGMVVDVSPVTNPDSGAAGLTRWDGYVSSSNTVTVRECGLGVVTPNATAYNVAVIQ